MIDVYVKGLSIDIGRQGENLARNIYFDLSELINTYGEGTATLVHMRPLDKAPYVCAVTRSDTFLIWAPTSTDTAYAGAGKCELRWVVGDVLAKSIVYRTSVTESITGDSTVPSEYESWYEALLEHISEYEIASDQIAANTSQIAANTSDIAVLDGRMDEFTTLTDGSTTGDAELADIRVGYDGTVYSNAGEAVRTQIADVKSTLSYTDSSIKKILSPNLYNPDDPDVLQNQYINPNGKIETISDRTVTGFLPVIPGQKVVMSRDVNGTRYDGTWSSICFYNANKAVVDGGEYNTNKLTVPTGAAYVRVTFGSTYSKVQIECNGNGTRTDYMPFGYLTFDNTLSSDLFPASAKEVGEQLNSIRDIIDNIRDITDNITEAKSSRNLYNPDDPDVLQNQYINPNGKIETISDRTVTGFLPVIPGQKVVMSRDINGTRYDETWASICFYNANKAAVDGGQYHANKLSVPTGAAYVRVTFGSTYSKVQIECNISGEMTAYEPYFFPYDELNPDIKVNFDSVIGIDAIKNIPDSFSWRGNLSSGDIIRLPVTNVKNQQVYAFSGNISTFRKLKIGRIFQNSTTYGAFEIDSTNVIFYCDNGSTYTIPHGLTIVNNIQITLATENSIYITKAVLTSNGTQFDICANLENKRFLADEGAPFVQSDESTLTECSFSWTSRNISKPIWMFGDSYMSFYDVRWVYYLVTAGYDKACLINAYAGEASSAALASLQNLLTLKSKPKYILWAMGMNDGDTNEAVNASWKSCFDAVVELCEKEGIILILATIPNTPKIENSYKNAIVRNSGHRYIDFASSVGANTSGSGWYSGMLNSDNVHPDIPGAIALYNQALADFPELTVT